MNNRIVESKTGNFEKYANLAVKVIFCAQVIFFVLYHICLLYNAYLKKSLFFLQLILVSIAVISLHGCGYNDQSIFPYVYPNPRISESILPLWLSRWYCISMFALYPSLSLSFFLSSFLFFFFSFFFHSLTNHSLYLSISVCLSEHRPKICKLT